MATLSHARGRMRKKCLYSYAGLIFIVLLSYVFPHTLWALVLPLYLLSIPAFLRGKINLYFSVNQALFALLISAVILVPLLFAFPAFFTVRKTAFSALVIQLLAVSFPEEVYFRGFLQDALRNDLMGVLIVSLMFCAAHIPALLFRGEISAPMTFFPSLVMGFLYMKTRNVLPSTIFHFLSNVVFSGFMI